MSYDDKFVFTAESPSTIRIWKKVKIFQEEKWEYEETQILNGHTNNINNFSISESG